MDEQVARRVWSLSLYSSYCGSERARRRVGWGRGWSFSCRSRSKLQQTSGKALLWRDRQEEKKERLVMLHI